MDKEERILDLKLKILDLKLDKERDIHSLSLTILIGFLTFFVTSGIGLKIFNQSIYDLTTWAISLKWYFAVLILLLLVFGLPFLAGFIGKVGIDIILKSKERIYNKNINELEKMISQLSSKKK